MLCWFNNNGLTVNGLSLGTLLAVQAVWPGAGRRLRYSSLNIVKIPLSFIPLLSALYTQMALPGGPYLHHIYVHKAIVAILCGRNYTQHT